MKINIFFWLFILCFIGFCISHTKVIPVKTHYIDFPEEIQAVSTGDTLLIYEDDTTTYLSFYHKNDSVPANSKIVIVK